MPPNKISIDQAHRLLTAMGLPLHTPGPDGADGFTATARGGRTGTQPVQAAARITINYRYANGYQLTGADVQEPAPGAQDTVMDEIRSHYVWAVEHAPDHGHAITWETGTARLTLTRAEESTATVTPRPAADPVPPAAVPSADRRYILDTIALAARTVPIHLDPHTLTAAQRGEGATLSDATAAEIARVVLDALDALDPPGHNPTP